MDNSSEQPATDTNDFRCRGVIVGGEWPEGRLSAESLSPWWKPSDSGDPLEVITGPLPDSLCQHCTDIRDYQDYGRDMSRTIQQLQPETCGLCRVLFVGYKIYLRNCPATVDSQLSANLANHCFRRVPLELSLDGWTTYSKTCSGLLITCNVHNSMLRLYGATTC